MCPIIKRFRCTVLCLTHVLRGTSRFAGELPAVTTWATGEATLPLGAHMSDLLDRITINPAIFGGKPIIRGHRLAVEHVLGMLATGDDVATILEGYPWMEREDVVACVEYARRLVAHERVAPRIVPSAA